MRLFALIATSLLALAGAAAPASASAAGAEPIAIVEQIAQRLGETMDARREELSRDRNALNAVIDDVVLRSFDTEYAALLVMGRYAREATPAQRERFTRAFYDSLVNRYGEALLQYTRGSVVVLPFRGELNDRRTTVRTQVVTGDGTRIPVDYAFRKTRSGEWKVFDVVIEGISYVTNYRNQVVAEIQKTDIDAVIVRLEQQGLAAIDADAG
jgi:phospholipid transport system substrate-binding protein